MNHSSTSLDTISGFKYITTPLKLLSVLCVCSALSSCSGTDEKSSSALKIQHNESKEGLYGMKDRDKGFLDSIDNIDPHVSLDRGDFKEEFWTRRQAKPAMSAAPLQLPKLSSMLQRPSKQAIKHDKLVTLSVTEDIPIKDVLLELARRADIDLELDPNISGGVIFSVRERPFSQVVERITRLAGLRYSIEDNVLKVERDSPYLVNYGMHILNSTRTHEAQISTSETETATSSATLTVANEDGDMWSVIQSAVSNILRQNQVSQTAQIATTADPTAPAPAAAPTASGDEISEGVISINRQAGVVSIMANDVQHKKIKQFLDYLQITATSQVQIEAKVVEVSLNDQYRSGVKWDMLSDNLTGLTTSNNFATGPTGNKLFSEGSDSFSLGVLPTELFGIDSTSIDFSVELLEQFGVTRALSSPRLSTMNNQFAVLNFTENLTYFTITVEQEEEESTSGAGTSSITIDSEENIIPVGVSLTLQPSIDLERSEIVMNIRPRLTREIEGAGVSDPAVDLNAALIATQAGNSELANQIRNIQSVVPRVSTRELDTVMRIKSGSVMVIGGLMEERTSNIDQGVPGVSQIPVLGNAFKSVQKSSEVVETVIFLKATIVPGQGVSVADKKFYKKFTSDRDPLSF